MNYCSLEDAWGNFDYITNQYKKYENNIIENFDEVNYEINDNIVLKKPVEKLTKKLLHKCVFTCDDFISHLNKCPKCRMKIKKQFSSKLVNKIQHIIFDNKDTILLILITLFILIFLNLLHSILKKN